MQYPCQQGQLLVLSLYKLGFVAGNRNHIKPKNPASVAAIDNPEMTTKKKIWTLLIQEQHLIS